MTNNHPVENLMRSTMENLKDMIDVNTVIGDTVETGNGTYIIPISKVTFGFASGGSDFCTLTTPNEISTYPFGGGSGAGVTVKPVAFLVVREDTIRLLPLEQDTTYDRIVDTIPQIIDMVKNGLKKENSSKEEETI